MTSMPKGRPGSKTYMKSRQTVRKTSSGGDFLRAATSIDNATVYLYDADHPEWLYPVSESSTDSSGNYLLKTMKNSSRNLDAAGSPVYSDGDYIPEGNYTLLAFKPGGFDPILGITTDPVVAVQTVVNTFSGTVSAADLAAQSSTVRPKIDTIIGLKKNTDGTQTWGNTGVVIPGNAGIPVSFSMAMSRASVLNGVSIVDVTDADSAVNGEWKVSADWLSAVFHPTTDLVDTHVYRVTVSGADTADTSPVTNVYGNALKRTGIALFTAGPADPDSPTVQIVSPAAATGVSLFDPIRITSDDALDVNSLVLTSSPSLGVKPGVFFVGETGGQYVYEFLLADPLAPNTTYSITVSGGTDMSGNAMASVSHTFTTLAASSVTGIDPAADTVTQGIQSDVLNVFGRWVRAFNDRSIGMLQEMMTGDYVFEYDVSAHGPSEEDLNRDGRLDLEEFSAMISNGFSWWDHCGTVITGAVVGNVNVNAAADIADFQFDLDFTATNTSQDCTDSPDELFATVYNINGKWQLGRVSESVDTRNRELSVRTVMSGLKLTQNDTIVGSEAAGNIDGATLMEEPLDPMGIQNYPVEFSWNAVDGATAYVFYIVNARDDSRGRAFILPATQTKWKMPFDPTNVNQNYVRVHRLFGFGDEYNNDPAGGAGFTIDLKLDRPGEEFYWTVMALDSNVPGDFDIEEPRNRSYDPENPTDKSRATDLFQQISAISHQFRFKTPGIYKELTVSVDDMGSNTITYNERFGGYDAGAADQVQLQINSPNLTAGNGMAQVYVNGHSWQSYTIDMAQPSNNGFDANGDVTVTIDLFQGWNWIDIWDGVDLNTSFNIQTTGGTPPIMSITSVMDQLGNSYTPDAWGFIDVGATDVRTVTVTGTITDPTIFIDSGASPSLNFNFWNDRGINDYKQIQMVVDGSGNGSFSVQIPVYGGHNWIDFDANYCDQSTPGMCNYAYTYMGVDVDDDKGTPWTAPIHDVSVTTAVLTDDYGQSQNWDASTDTDNVVTVAGVMEYPAGSMTPWYNISSDGDWKDGQLSVNADGSFSIPVSLYNGWNYVNVNDGEGNWFGVTIYTSAGDTVIRPQIDTIESVAYNGTGFAAVSGCTATITGQALANSQVQVNWNGDDGAGNYYYESVYTTTGNDNGNGFGNFTATVPVISDGYNNVDVFDANWRGVFVQLSTTNVGCSYTVPVLTVDPVIGGATDTGNSIDYTSTLDQVTLSGTSNIPNRQIVIKNYTCSGEEKFVTNADGAGNWSVTADVYQDYNWLDISDGYNYQGVSVYSTTSVQPTSSITPVVTPNAGAPTLNSSGCNYVNYDVGAATSVTISGTTTSPDGDGTYWDADGVMQTFSITGGVFSFTVNVYEGYNYVSLNDTNYNYYGFDLNSTNGVQKPRIVDIQSHAHDQVLGAGTYTVTGLIDTSNGFNADRVTAYVYDESAGNSYDFTSDSNDQTAYGYGAISLGVDGSGNQTFSFDITVTDTLYPFYISVDANDEVNWISHGHSIYLNNVYNYGQWSYKPGATLINQSKVKELKDRANKQRASDAFMQMQNRQ